MSNSVSSALPATCRISLHFRNLTSKFPTRDDYYSRCTWIAVGSLLVKDRAKRDTPRNKRPEGAEVYRQGRKVPATGPNVKQSAEGATDAIILSPFQGCHAGCLLLQGLHPCLCSDTPSGLIHTPHHTKPPPDLPRGEGNPHPQPLVSLHKAKSQGPKSPSLVGWVGGFMHFSYTFLPASFPRQIQTQTLRLLQCYSVTVHNSEPKVCI